MMASTFLVMMACVASALLFGPGQAAAAHERTEETQIRVTDVPPVAPRNSFYISNRDPLTPNPLIKLPPGSVVPNGWLRVQLESMRDGMIGHMAELSPHIRPESGWLNAWGAGDELEMYWLKGYLSLGYSLNDPAITGEAEKWVRAVMATQDDTGQFGPAHNAYGPLGAGSKHLWPEMRPIP